MTTVYKTQDNICFGSEVGMKVIVCPRPEPEGFCGSIVDYGAGDRESKSQNANGVHFESINKQKQKNL